MVEEIRAAYYESSSQNDSKKPFNSGYIKLPDKIAKQMPVMDTAFSSGKLPGRTDLTPLMPPVADQGNQGSCAAFTLGYALNLSMKPKNRHHPSNAQLEKKGRI